MPVKGRSLWVSKGAIPDSGSVHFLRTPGVQWWKFLPYWRGSSIAAQLSLEALCWCRALYSRSVAEGVHGRAQMFPAGIIPRTQESHPIVEDDETWLDRLEQQSEAIVPRDLDELQVQIQLVQRMAELASYRGTDVHVDTLSFYRPDRLPRASVDARQWLWKIAKGWKWKQPDHINVLEMEALYQTVRWRAKSNRLFRKRFLHLVDSQVVLGVAAKGRTSLKLRRSLHKYNMLVLALHTFPLLGWVLSHLNPSDVPSRWYEPPSSM